MGFLGLGIIYKDIFQRFPFIHWWKGLAGIKQCLSSGIMVSLHVPLSMIHTPVLRLIPVFHNLNICLMRIMRPVDSVTWDFSFFKNIWHFMEMTTTGTCLPFETLQPNLFTSSSPLCVHENLVMFHTPVLLSQWIITLLISNFGGNYGLSCWKRAGKKSQTPHSHYRWYVPRLLVLLRSRIVSKDTTYLSRFGVLFTLLVV